jgi:hypothetical protein
MGRHDDDDRKRSDQHEDVGAGGEISMSFEETNRCSQDLVQLEYRILQEPGTLAPIMAPPLGAPGAPAWDLGL